MRDTPQRLEYLDGSLVFGSPDDQRNEAAVAAQLAAAWDCELHEFGPVSPIDRWATRHGRFIGLIEIKCRSNPHDRYPTVYLNVRKWSALLLVSAGLACPAIFVVRFTDGTRWVCLDQINPRAFGATVGGWSPDRHIAHDRNETTDLLIQVPVAIMRRLTEGTPGHA